MAKSYDDWQKVISSSVNNDADYVAAKNKLAETTGAKPTYAGTYDNDIADAYKNIINRPEFNYSLDDDALYKQYADKYMQAGKLAMKDTMGQAAALTGGYGSSYGQKVGQQTYDQYLQGLGDVALDMYDRAYGRYQDEGDRLKDAYGLAKDMGDTEYNRFMDAFNRWNNERSYWTDRADSAYGRAYQTGSDAYARSTAEADQEYNRSLDQAQTLAAYGDFSGFAALFGSDRAAEMQKVWNAGNPDLAYNTGRISAEEYRAMTGQYPAGYQAPYTGGGGGRKKTGDDDEDVTNKYEELLTGPSTSDYILADLYGSQANSNGQSGKSSNSRVVIDNNALSSSDTRKILKKIYG